MTQKITEVTERLQKLETNEKNTRRRIEAT